VYVLVAHGTLLVGCGDNTDHSGTTNPSPTAAPAPAPNPAAAAPPAQPPPARQLSSSELERYRNELQKLMPDKRVDRVSPAQPGGEEGVHVTGFDSVIIAKRNASGGTDQVCVDNRDRAMEFLSAPPRRSRSALNE
jgi:hypothetical protein